MEKINLETVVLVAVEITAEKLTDDELQALYLIAMLKSDPRKTIGYDKAAALFTDVGGTMSPIVLAAFGRVWQQRIGSKQQR